MTGADGVYLFEDLPSGDYTVTVIMNSVPAGYSLATDPDGALDGRYAVSLGVGETFTTADFGFVGLGSIGDTVWYDTDGDAVQDAGEPGIAGVTASLYTDVDRDGRIDPGEPLYGTASTDANGEYSFALLAPGYYVVDVSISDPALAGHHGDDPTTTPSLSPRPKRSRRPTSASGRSPSSATSSGRTWTRTAYRMRASRASPGSPSR